MSDSPKQIITVGSRKSQLAMIQTNLVIEKLKALYDDIEFHIESMDTLGDKILDVALNKIGGKSLFTKELELALETKQVDFVVHSLKDLPTTLPTGLVIGAVCKRDNPMDVMIMHPKHQKKTIKELPQNSIIGTSSLRRSAQLKRSFPHLKFENIRGNLNTRLKKLDEGTQYDAIVLAAAGITRMGWGDKVSHFFEAQECMYAVGQGAIAVECRQNDEQTLKLLNKLNDDTTVYSVVAERSFMRRLEGGCSVPLGVHTTIDKNTLTLKGGVWSLDGETQIAGEYSSSLIPWNLEENSNGTEAGSPDSSAKKRSCKDNDSPPAKRVKTDEQDFCGLSTYAQDIPKIKKAYEIGINLADMLIQKGARDVLKEAKESVPDLSKPIPKDSS